MTKEEFDLTIEVITHDILSEEYPITQHPDYQNDKAYDIDDVKDMIRKALIVGFQEGEED